MTFRDPYGRNPYGQFGSGDTWPRPFTATIKTVVTPIQFVVTAQIEITVYSVKCAATIEADVTPVRFILAAPLELVVYAERQFAATIQCDVVLQSYIYSAGMECRVFAERQYTAVIEAQVFGAHSHVWSPHILIDGADLSSIATREIRIVSEEDASTLATVYLDIPSGAIDVVDWMNKPALINYVDGGWRGRRFTGSVSSIEYDPASGIMTLLCDSSLQAAMETRTTEQIAADIPGSLYSVDVQGEMVDGWKHAQERMKTVPGSLWMDKKGGVRYSLWAAKSTADFVISAGGYIPRSLSIKWADRRDIINSNQIAVDYRFKKLRQRDHWFGFSYTGTICDWFTDPHPMPQKEHVRSAAVRTGWALTSICYTELPKSQRFTCNTRLWSWLNWPPHNHCMGASFTLSKRWAQVVTENYDILVTAPDSIASMGAQGVTEAYGITSEYDASDWENKEFSAPSSGMIVDLGGSGDTSKEADPARRVEMELAQKVILQKASTEILYTHRDNEVSFKTVLIPSVDLSHTIELQSAISTKAKVRRITEVLNIASGEATQMISLAVSRHNGVGTASDTPLDPPERPQPTAEAPYSKRVPMGFRIGPGTLPSGVVERTGEVNNLGDDDFNGYSCNRATWAYDPQKYAYPEGMTVITPEIDGAAINAAIVNAQQAYTVAVPQDPLTVTK